jgi:hypothetical protein
VRAGATSMLGRIRAEQVVAEQGHGTLEIAR